MAVSVNNDEARYGMEHIYFQEERPLLEVDCSDVDMPLLCMLETFGEVLGTCT